MTDEILIKLYDIEDSHGDLYLKISSLNLEVFADSYYFQMDNEIIRKTDKTNKEIGIIELLEGWCDSLLTLNTNNKCFLPFDFSDEYIGCLRFESLNNESLKMTYGYTKKIMGMMINPSKLEQFQISDGDFFPDSETLKLERENLVNSIRKSLEKIKINKQV